jgi:hypothetical protein
VLVLTLSALELLGASNQVLGTVIVGTALGASIVYVVKYRRRSRARASIPTANR